MPKVIRAVLFDLDGVIRRFDPAREAEIETRHGLPLGTLWPVLFENRRLTAAVTGKLTDEAWREDAANELMRAVGPHAVAALKELGESPGAVDAEVLAVVREVRRRLPTGLLTNGTSRLPKDLAWLDLNGEFDAILNTSTVGCRKPDAKAYYAAAALLGAPPESIAFFDDSESHIAGALAVGMTARRFTTAVQLRADLAELAVL